MEVSGISFGLGMLWKISETLRESWSSKFGNCWSRQYLFHPFKIHLMLFFHVHVDVQVVFFSHFFLQSVYGFPCPMCATCFMHLIPDLIALIKFGEEFLNTFSICSFLNLKAKVICIFYILISDCAENQYTYICLGCSLIQISKLSKPEVTNNCLLLALCVSTTVILFG